ncbi:MAG: hypothetical protein H7A45_15705 [Verrucomicrobiales bacterium]|nr:hypothetical protein [Verrucomicrobiales bacterium]
MNVWPRTGSSTSAIPCSRSRPSSIRKRFRGTCYKAAGWQRLGSTWGCQRDWQDFYTDTTHPKQLWVRALGPAALKHLRAAQLPPHLAAHERPLPPASVRWPRASCFSLWQCFAEQMHEPRRPRASGIRWPRCCV